MKVAYVIFEVKSEDIGKIKQLTKDDVVSRQSILTRDSSSLNLKGEFSYVKIEGSDNGLKRAEELSIWAKSPSLSRRIPRAER